MMFWICLGLKVVRWFCAGKGFSSGFRGKCIDSHSPSDGREKTGTSGSDGTSHAGGDCGRSSETSADFGGVRLLLADAFMAENPNVTINIYYLSWENVANSVADGSPEDPVDGFMLSFREEMWTEKFLNVWKEKCEDFAQTEIVDLSMFNPGGGVRYFQTVL